MTSDPYPDMDHIRPPSPETPQPDREIAPEDLTASADEGVLSLAAGAESQGHRAVVRAKGQVGVQESGGEDRGVPLERYVQYFLPNSGPLPWCAFFVSWCIDCEGDRNKRLPWANPGYVGSVYAWARDRGHLVSQPQHGDMFGSGDVHMGLVAGANASRGVIWTTEGNWSDRVGHWERRTAGLWFARLPW